MSNASSRNRLEMPSWSVLSRSIFTWLSIIQWRQFLPLLLEHYFTSPDMQKMFLRVWIFLPKKMFFMLSNYSPWDHYILPMMEDYYCSLLVIFWMSCLSSCCCRTTSKCLPIFCHYCEIQGPNPSTKFQGSCPANVQGRICSSLRPLLWCPRLAPALSCLKTQGCLWEQLRGES